MRLPLALALCLIGVTARAADIVTYPAPATERQGAFYQVWAGDQQVDVYTTRTLDEPFAGKQWDYGGPYCFANFDLAGTVVVKVTSSRSLRGTVVRPLSAGVQPELVDDHTLTIKLEKPQKLSIEPDGRKGPLLLFANPLEGDRPQPADPGIIYFGPGVHKPEKITVGDNQTLYLAGGAVVKAEVVVQGDNVRRSWDVVSWMDPIGSGGRVRSAT